MQIFTGFLRKWRTCGCSPCLPPTTIRRILFVRRRVFIGGDAEGPLACVRDVHGDSWLPRPRGHRPTDAVVAVPDCAQTPQPVAGPEPGMHPTPNSPVGWARAAAGSSCRRSSIATHPYLQFGN